MRWQGWAGLGAIALLAGFLVGLRGCPETPKAVSTSQPSAVSTAQSGSGVKVTIRRPVANPVVAPVARPTSQEPFKGAFGPAQVSEQPPSFEEIVIEATTSASAAATTSDPIEHRQISDVSHARLGVIAGPFPGLLAADFELARIDVPPWVIGMPLDVGLDVEANHLQAGAGLSLGGKLFVTGGGYVTYGLVPGYYLASGLRF